MGGDAPGFAELERGTVACVGMFDTIDAVIRVGISYCAGEMEEYVIRTKWNSCRVRRVQ